MKYYQKCLLIVLAAAGFFTMPVMAAPLDELVVQAVRENPEIKAGQARWETFVNRARQAGSFDDPMLMVGIKNGLVREPFDLSRDPATAKVIGISQMLPYFGKRDLKHQVAEHEAAANRWNFEERKIALQQMVKETWYRLYLIDRSLETVSESIATLDDLNRFVETMYGTGAGLQQDVIKAQLQRSKMEDMRIVLRQQRRSLEAALNVLLNRPTEEPVALTPKVEPDDLSLDATALERLSEMYQPRLKSLAEQIEKAKAGRKLADLEFYPDFTLSFEYMQRQAAMNDPGFDMFDASISFNLPIQRERRHAMVAEADSELHMAQEELNMERNRIREGIADGLARLARSSQLADLYRNGIIPQAGNALEAAMAAYRVGKIDFMNVLDSQMALFNYEREYYDAVAEHQMQLAQMEGVVGTTLPPSAVPPTETPAVMPATAKEPTAQ